jgi:hypothetical protein
MDSNIMKLWDYYDGEPWMDNPQLGILSLGTTNPRKRGKKGKKMAKRRQPAALRKYWATHRRKKGRKHTAKRSRRRARRNWVSPGMVVAANPHRKRRRSRMNARHHRRTRRHYRRNPHFLGFELPAIKEVVFAGVGFAGPSFVQGFLTTAIPSVMQSITSMGVLGKYLIKAGTVAGLAWVTRRFVGSRESNAVMVGGGVNIALSLVQDFAPGLLPANPLAMYVPRNAGMSAYVPTRPGLRAAGVPVGGHNVAPFRAGIPSAAPFRRLGVSGPWGSASRYQRY